MSLRKAYRGHQTRSKRAGTPFVQPGAANVSCSHLVRSMVAFGSLGHAGSSETVSTAQNGTLLAWGLGRECQCRPHATAALAPTPPRCSATYPLKPAQGRAVRLAPQQHRKPEHIGMIIIVPVASHATMKQDTRGELYCSTISSGLVWSTTHSSARGDTILWALDNYSG